MIWCACGCNRYNSPPDPAEKPTERWKQTKAGIGEYYIGEHYAQGYQCKVEGGSDYITMGA
jgi:hypothetical protein